MGPFYLLLCQCIHNSSHSDASTTSTNSSQPSASHVHGFCSAGFPISSSTLLTSTTTTTSERAVSPQKHGPDSSEGSVRASPPEQFQGSWTQPKHPANHPRHLSSPTALLLSGPKHFPLDEMRNDVLDADTNTTSLAITAPGPRTTPSGYVSTLCRPILVHALSSVFTLSFTNIFYPNLLAALSLSLSLSHRFHQHWKCCKDQPPLN